VGAVEPVADGGSASSTGTGMAELGRAGYAYAFEPGAESSMRLLAALLAADVRVRHAPRAFRAAGNDFPLGAFVVVTGRNDPSVHELIREKSRETGARVIPVHSARVETGTDLGSSSVRPIPTPRVALIGGDGVSTGSFGAAWHTFDEHLGFPVVRVRLDGLTRAVDDFNVVVLPSAFDVGAVLGETGTDALRQWVQGGGTLITLDAATAWLASETGFGRLLIREETERHDGQVGAPLPAAVPGAILRARATTASPLLAGVTHTDVPVLLFGSNIYDEPADVRPGEVVLRYADVDHLRLAGYLWPELPDQIAETPYLWTEGIGSGRVIAFTGDPNFRGMWRGLLPLFANAVFLGGTM